MSFNYKSLLPTPAQIKAEFPLTPECVELKAARDKEVADVITGKSEKFLVIIGPVFRGPRGRCMRVYEPPCKGQ